MAHCGECDHIGGVLCSGQNGRTRKDRSRRTSLPGGRVHLSPRPTPPPGDGAARCCISSGGVCALIYLMTVTTLINSPPIPSSVASDGYRGAATTFLKLIKVARGETVWCRGSISWGKKCRFRNASAQNQNLSLSPSPPCSAEDAKKMRPALLDSSPAYQGGPPRQAA